jgi:hypothetical protein
MWTPTKIKISQSLILEYIFHHIRTKPFTE